MRNLIGAGLAALALFGIAASAVAGPFEDGLAAYARGDYETSVQLWRPLADQGVPEAQFRIGYMYAHGLGVPQDGAAAAKWYRQAANQGNPDGLRNLAGMYLTGAGGLPRDSAMALTLYREAAAQGDPLALDTLGSMYMNGWSVRQDYVEGLAWYRKAVSLGNKSAMTGLGRAYENGWGVPQDYVQAYKWYNLGSSIKNRDNVAINLSPTQLATAQQLAREWKPSAPSVAASAVASATPVAAVQPNSQAAAVGQMQVAVKSARLRAEPSTSSPKLASITQGTVVDVIEMVEGGTWAHIKANDSEGYVSANLLQPVGSPSQPAASRQMTVIVDSARLRAEPSTSSPKLVSLTRGTVVDVIEMVDDGKWAHVKANDMEGYVSAELLQ